ncbi:MAG: glycosyltransferase [Jatrophihabitantaceae bacterium]
MRVIRVLGKLEPGGAQLALLRVMRALEQRHGIAAELWVGDASIEGIRLARRYGVRTVAYRTSREVPPVRNLQWQLSDRFATWLAAELPPAELVHAHMVGAWWAAAQAVSASTPVAATEHNQVNWSAGRVRSLRPSASRVDRFYAMGPAAARFAVQAGVRAEVLRPARSPVAGLRARPTGQLRSPRLTFAGRFCPDKGPDLLLEAIALLDRPDLACYLLGDGALRAGIAERVERYNMSAQVFLPGWVDRPWTYVAGSSVHVVPSREEAWSQSAVLALGLGVAVVGARVDGLAETLADWRGVLVPPEDPAALSRAIAEILTGCAPIDRLAGRRYARRFSCAKVADFYLAEYQGMRSGAAPVRARDSIEPCPYRPVTDGPSFHLRSSP